ncbi:MAG TPA: type II toxin-antitoxin system RelE/ParE family toxin [Anaerolineales bacterium]|jgi:mRNA interferase RelE/StbE|nr:type II toxin-antitoxin system RelE/ParE family toxin [Anaerolineales bacterium]MDX9937920.1 type II toxin-antitoxin system RelE/ParE family toxin [Anaerolineales bacterium]GER79291.1 type II toxin-antitoxin system mRNA interferase toxin, RelE/StbE family [Candidatus Denitrolinea symbiosum]HMN00902.1 type II toxin-antitoxin system RelE/ParE family toxin [Anaerolineales bacterium]
MKLYQVILTPEAQADLRRIASATRTRLLDKLEWMGENAELIQHQALQGDEWKGCFKYRVGDYRIVYRLDHPAVKLVVLKVGHRREVYK